MVKNALNCYLAIQLYLGMVKASMKIGSQRYYSTPLFRKNNEGRMSPNVLSADYIVGLTDGEGSFLRLSATSETSTWLRELQSPVSVLHQDAGR